MAKKSHSECDSVSRYLLCAQFAVAALLEMPRRRRDREEMEDDDAGEEQVDHGVEETGDIEFGVRCPRHSTS